MKRSVTYAIAMLLAVTLALLPQLTMAKAPSDSASLPGVFDVNDDVLLQIVPTGQLEKPDGKYQYLSDVNRSPHTATNPAKYSKAQTNKRQLYAWIRSRSEHDELQNIGYRYNPDSRTVVALAQEHLIAYRVAAQSQATYGNLERRE